jgi:hypothetical protein
MEKKNREQRRREKFGRAGGATTEPWPQSQANPALSHVGSTDEAAEAVGDESAHSRGPDKDATPQKGSASGGATKGPKRIVDHEGIHSGDNAKG